MTPLLSLLVACQPAYVKIDPVFENTEESFTEPLEGSETPEQSDPTESSESTEQTDQDNPKKFRLGR